jgi:hypothetical protein
LYLGLKNWEEEKQRRVEFKKRTSSSSLHDGCAFYTTSIRMINILNWRHMVIGMVKSKWILEFCWK